MNTNDKFKTSDLSTAAALMTLGHELIGVEKEVRKNKNGQDREVCTFAFDLPIEAGRSIMIQVIAGALQAPIINVLNSTKRLKAIIHQDDK